jgi:hypothetical protein
MKKKLLKQDEPWALPPQEPKQLLLPKDGLQLSLLATIEYSQPGNPVNHTAKPVYI